VLSMFRCQVMAFERAVQNVAATWGLQEDG